MSHTFLDSQDSGIQEAQNFEPDYSFVYNSAEIAIYDDLSSAPRLVRIEPDETEVFISNLAQNVYEEARLAGGSIPYTVIRELSENFIHARFSEVVVSILNKGETIRFSDQGPGIKHKKQALKPGFSSAISPMRTYIRGVGSGLCIANEYMQVHGGSILIEDNVDTGTVVTISSQKIDQDESFDTEKLENTKPEKPKEKQPQIAQEIVHQAILRLKPDEKRILEHFSNYGRLGNNDLAKIMNMSPSTVNNKLEKLEKEGLIKKDEQKKRSLTEFGELTLNYLS